MHSAMAAAMEIKHKIMYIPATDKSLSVGGFPDAFVRIKW
jgi:hypothetical protein